MKDVCMPFLFSKKDLFAETPFGSRLFQGGKFFLRKLGMCEGGNV